MDSKGIPKVEAKNLSVKDIHSKDGERWDGRVSLFKFHTNRLLKHIYLRQIEIPHTVNESDLFPQKLVHL